MKKIKIKDFVEDYNKRPKQTKETYIKDNLEVVSYIPLAKKIALVDKLIDVSMYEFEDYVKENGEKSRRRTNRIKVDSVVQYFLFCRTLIEAYTNLEKETDNFFEEYDLLKSSGLLDKLIVGDEERLPLISIDEIAEMKSLVEMKQKDVITNYMNIQSFVSDQISRFGDIMSVLKPIVNNISTKLDNMTEEDSNMLHNKLVKLLK